MNRKIIFTFILVFVFCMFIPYISLAISTDSYTNIYKNPSGSASLFNKGGKILGILQVVGTGLAVIMMSVTGLRYIFASPQEKAQSKETIMPIFIGSILLFGGVNILAIVYRFVIELAKYS